MSATRSATRAPAYDWTAVPWKHLQRAVFRLQKRIYQAARRGDHRAVHQLQRLLLASRAARYLAVRRVTQDNRGKRTAGVDGVKALTPPQRVHLAETLRLPEQARPLRRVWIPKPGSTEQRPLGIPTLRDRATQALALLALEPEWEARFDANSYGFRPGRSAHDAIGAIFLAICRQPKYVLDADIEKCFDRIDHQVLLAKLGTFAPLRRAVRAWLKAGVLDGETLFPTTEGTPQGGVVSPLLANIAVHGLAEAVAHLGTGPGRGGGRRGQPPRVIRYADDFVVLHAELAVIQAAQEAINTWLAGVGLRLKPSKTRVTHTLTTHEGNVGFDFLGFTVRQFRVGQTHSGKSTNGSKRLGFKTLIRPSRAAQQRHQAAIRQIVRDHRTAAQATLIHRLNPRITGWCHYHRTVVAKAVFQRMDGLLYAKLRRWAERRHPKHTGAWAARKYWAVSDGEGWVFRCRDGPRLRRHAATPIRRHVKVQGARSPYDGDWVYWGTRAGKHPELPTWVATLLKWQQGRCARCGLRFTAQDVVERDHIIPRQLGGKDGYTNWQLLHGHCHDAKSAEDRELLARLAEEGGTEVNGRSVEEPGARKRARPVLEASGVGDRSA